MQLWFLSGVDDDDGGGVKERLVILWDIAVCGRYGVLWGHRSVTSRVWEVNGWA